MKRLILTLTLLGTIGCWAQQAAPITTSQLTIPANAVRPSPPATVNATRVGTPGPNLYYYWVVADLPIGWSAPSAAALVSSSNGTLDTNNYNRVTWSIVTGATNYQVLRTTTSAQPAPGCTCATAGGTVTATSFNDQSNTLGVYSNSPWSGDTSFNVTNKVVGAGESQLTFASDHGSMFEIDNITGAVLPAPTLNNATLTGTTTVKGPFQASGGGEFTGTWPNAGTITGGAVNPATASIGALTATSPAITPTSIEQVEYADQFPGADMGAKINAAIASCPSTGCTVVVPTGQYTISTPLVANPTQTVGSTTSGLTITSAAQTWQYNSPVAQTVLLAAPGFSGGELLNLQYAKNVTVSNLTIACASGSTPATFDGIRFGNPTQSSSIAGLSLDHVSTYGCNRGLYEISGGVTQITDSQFTGGDYGVYFFGSGDSTITDSYINTNATTHVPTAYNDFTGAGIFLGAGSNNVNISGGKIEWNAYGVVVYASQGVNISGAQFDTNYVHHIYVLEDGTSDPANLYTKSINIIGNRFLSGGNQTGSYPGAGDGIFLYAAGTGNQSDELISGNTFSYGGVDAYDGNTTAPLGPSIAIDANGGGASPASLTISNNDLLNSAATDAVRVFDTSLQIASNAVNLPIVNNGGSTIQNLEPVGITIPGGTSGTATIEAPSVAGASIVTLPGATTTLAGLGIVQTWTAAQTFPSPVFTGTTTAATLNATTLEQGGNAAVTNGGTSLTSGTPTCGSGVAAVADCTATQILSGATLSRGTITITSATSGAHTFTTAYGAAPVCVASENSATPTALTFGVTSSTTAVTVTLSTSGSGTFTWSCGPAVN